MGPVMMTVCSQIRARFSETQDGKVAVAEVFDAMTEGMWDLISDPTARSQCKGVKKQQDVRTKEDFVQEVTDPDAAAHAAQGVTPDGVFIRAADGTQVNATQPVNAVIEIQQQSQSGSTFLLGHELAHNLLDVLRRSGQLTAEQDAALAEHFKDKNGKFDEEAFADAFGKALRDSFAEQEQARLEEAQGRGGAVSRLLRTLADTLKAWAYATKAMVWRRQAQAQSAQGTPSSVLDAFLQQQSNAPENPDGSTKATQNGGETRYHTNVQKDTKAPKTSDPERIANIEATEEIEIDIPQEGRAKEVFDLYNAHNERWKGKIADVVLSAGFVNEIEHNVDINEVRTSKGAIRDILSHGKGPLKALALQHIGRIIRDARLYSVGEKDGFRFYNLAHRITFEGKSLYAHLTVKEDRNGKRTYELGFKEKENVVEKLPIGSEPKQRGLGHLTSPQQNDGAKYHVQSQAAAREIEEAWENAVENGDDEQAGRLVREMAEKRGHVVTMPDGSKRLVEAFHGSNRLGFTVFDPKYSDDGISLFSAGSIDTAGSYTTFAKVVGAGRDITLEDGKEYESLGEIVQDLEDKGLDVDLEDGVLSINQENGQLTK